MRFLGALAPGDDETQRALRNSRRARLYTGPLAHDVDMVNGAVVQPELELPHSASRTCSRVSLSAYHSIKNY